MIVRRILCATLALAAAPLAAQTQAPAPRAMSIKPSAARLATIMAPAAPAIPAAVSPADMDARRAAAARLLTASRFRERQAVTIKDGMRTAELELADGCLQRAIDGRNMQTCKAIAEPGEVMRQRLAATESAILDEVVAAGQTIYAQRFTVAEMDEITRFFKTPVGQRYGAIYPQLLSDVQQRKRAILRRYLTKAAAETADHKAL